VDPLHNVPAVAIVGVPNPQRRVIRDGVDRLVQRAPEGTRDVARVAEEGLQRRVRVVGKNYAT
jgi:hypothetical protein